MNLVYYTAADLLSHIRGMASDETETYRWTDGQIYRSLNVGLRSWGTRIAVPWLFSVPTDWSNTQSYTLPDYMDERVVPQLRDSRGDEDTVRHWQDLPGWSVEADGEGGLTLHFTLGPVTGEGRLFWYRPVGHVTPVTATLDAEIDSDDTSLSLTLSEATPYLNDQSGWVKIDDEWLGYAGVEKNGLTLTLSNLVRGLDNTTPATHAISSTVHFGICLPRHDLLDLLTHQTLLALHTMPMGDASISEKDHHSVMVRYHQDMVEKLWRRIRPARKTRIKLTRDAIGDMGTTWN